MITASVNDKDELVITGKMEIGDKIKGLCCKGNNCEVIHIFRDKENSNDDSVWYGCESMSHNVAREKDAYAGIGSKSTIDIADWMVDNE